MTRTLRYLLLFVFTGLSGSAFAQEISGRVLDDKKEPLPSAVIQVYQGGILKGGNVTDYDGNYTVKPLDPGYYDVLVLYAGFDSIMVTEVVVAPGQRTTQNFTMARHVKGLKEFTVTAYKKPLVDQDKPASKILNKEEIAVIPTNQVTDLVSTSAGVYQAQRGQDVHISGARNTGTLYIIDGVQVQSTTGIDMAQGSVDQLEVITSGIPANYGDVSGGVVEITSRGVSQKMTGDVRLQHSIDGYNNNLVSFSVAGPVYKKKVKGETTKKPVLGFALSGDYYNDHDRYPDFEQQYTAKGDVLNRLLTNPLKIISDNSGSPVYNYASAYVTYDSLTKTKITPEKKIQEYRMNGKLDYQVTDNMHIVGGGTFDYIKQDQYSRARELFAADATPVLNTLTGRAYIRFTQKFGKPNDTSSRHSIISNAYYTVQADYQKTYQDQHDPTFKENIFDYAYVGKFNETRAPIYFPNQTDSLSLAMGHPIKGTMLLFSNPTGITFDRSHTLNPNLANYTTQLYNSLNGNNPLFITQIQALNGMANGDEPKYTYDLFYSPGATQSYYYKFNSNQYALTVNASFDLMLGKTRHAIGFGLYYQQRIEKEYAVYANPNGSGTQSLWQLMRQLVSSIDNGNLALDKQHPIFIVNGKQYTYDQVRAGAVIPGPNDTIIYNYQNKGNSVFDQNLRKKLGAAYTANGGNKDINIDSIAPSTFSLNMFSADELLNSGHGYVYYFGYGYDGQAQTGAVNFNDFWTRKDANGNFTRPIGAFSPNYIAGYLLDKFNYKDLHFNIGVRIDRYSANTKVLIDPYSELAEKNVSQVSGALNTNNGGQHPSNMGSNYVVYIDDNNSSAPSIIGYRDGNNWYDPTGKLILDPAVLKQYSGGRDPQPFIVKDVNGFIRNITDSNYNPNSAFTDYTPQVTLQPRLSFNFPISEVADFYAHYDIYAQRPTSNINANAADYYYLQQNQNSIINNPNLHPEKTFDYEVGFQQKLSASSALTISAFYKERKDQITLTPYLFAYPTTYYTYGNRDFSTTKGTTVFYDLRATNHLQMSLSYTLQFAEGTGSTPTSGNGGYGGAQISPNGLLQSFIQPVCLICVMFRLLIMIPATILLLI
ncbi:MAG: carboxypeptidase regulatory-like domain-containing protein [Chitinophagales bacterium]